MTGLTQPSAALQDFVHRQGLAEPGTPLRWTALTGGVSSDIWRLDLPERSLCIKAALPKLKVAGDWQAPVARNAHEWDWICFAHETMPGVVPQPVAHDAALGAFAMAFLDGAFYPVWKALLLQGQIETTTAEQVASILARLHGCSAGDEVLRQQFATDDIFYPIRLEPYLIETSRKHPQLRAVLEQMSESTLATKLALVHGDVSPKNILIGPTQPVILDAECAWYGDPAFDLAFCLNHFLLKCIARRAWAAQYLACFDRFAQTYLAAVTWESAQDLESRVARLLPALLLARIDGKSPVEYIVDEADKDLVRSVAVPLILTEPGSLVQVRQAWQRALAQAGEAPR
jgi:aminoglycoside phosphotransferase (APT) family kinase protein